MDFRNCSHGVNSAEYMRYTMNIVAKGSSHTFRHRPGRIAEFRALKKKALEQNEKSPNNKKVKRITGVRRSKIRRGDGVSVGGEY